MTDRIKKVVDGFWNNLNDMLDLFEEIVTDYYNDGLTDINPNFIQLGKQGLNNCMYPVSDHQPKDINEYKFLFVKKFAEKTHHNWSKINDHDEEYFVNSFIEIFINGQDNKKKNATTTEIDISNIFDGVLNSYAPSFHQLFSENIEPEDKNALWRYILRLIQQSCEFVYWNRKPDSTTGKFRERFLDDIKDVRNWMIQWKLIK